MPLVSSSGYPLVSGLRGPSVVPEGLIAHYEFESGSGTTAIDSTGNGYDAPINGGASWINDAAVGTSALSLNGTDAWVDLPNLIDAEPRTLVVFARCPATTTEGNYIAAQFDGAVGGTTGEDFADDFQLPANERFRTANDVHYHVANNDGLWHCYGLTLDGANSALYIDGTNVITFTPTYLDLADGDLRLGTKDFGRFFPGDIDEARLYDRGLSASEHGELAALGS